MFRTRIGKDLIMGWIWRVRERGVQMGSQASGVGDEDNGWAIQR